MPQALAVRSASLTVRMAEDALQKAVQGGASPARLAELGDVLRDWQDVYRDQLLRLMADIQAELALLPDQPEKVAGIHEPGKGW
jgi:hypothetical protein